VFDSATHYQYFLLSRDRDPVLVFRGQVNNLCQV